VRYIAEEPFKDREEVKKWIKTCGRASNISIVFACLFILVGVIQDALKIDLRLATTTWLMLGVFFAVTAIGPHIHIAAMENLYGMESENKNK
jgi:hypothetical protein